MNGSEAPLDLVVVGDFAGGDESAPLAGALHRVDKESLAELLERFHPEVALGSAEGAGGGTHRLSLASFRDFRPERLAEELPATRELLSLRRFLEDALSGRVDGSALKERLAAVTGPPVLLEIVRRTLDPGPPPAPPAVPPSSASPPVPPPSAPPPPPAPVRTSSSEDPLAAIFDMVDVAGSARGAEASGVEDAAPQEARGPSEAQQKLERILRQILETGGKQPVPAAAVRALAAEIDGLLTEELRAVLSHPRLRALESAWLSLRFLIRRIDFSSGIRVHLLAAPFSGLVAALRDQAFPFAEAARAEGRVACILLDDAFGGEAEEIERLSVVARLAEESRTLVMAAADPAIVGVESLSRMKGLPNINELAGAPERAAWRALRGEQAARWVALSAGRFLLRLPYGGHGEPVRGFAFEEEAEGRPARLWGNPTWLVGVLLAGSFSRIGWGVELTGAGEGGVIEDLPVCPLPLPTGEVVQAPLEALLPENRILEFSQAGIMAVGGRRNHDQAFFATAPMVYAPGSGEGEAASPAAARRASLPYQFFVAQVAAWAEFVWRRCDPGKPAEEVARTIAAGLLVLASTREGSPFAAGAEVVREEGRAWIRLQVEPRAHPLRGLPPMLLDMPVPGA